jgi:hypothetical protein
MLLKRLRLIGYIRTGQTEVTADQQRRINQEFCHAHNNQLIGFSETDRDKPCFGLQGVLQALNHVDGIIALDLDRFVHHAEDRLYELRPFLQNLLRSKKVLITIADGIETISASGQKAILEHLNEWNEREGLAFPTRNDFEFALSRSA